MSEVTPDDDIMDFTTTAKSPRFKIDADVFTGVIEIPAQKALEFSSMTQQFADENQDPRDRIELLKELIKVVLVPASAERFNERLSSSTEPIGLTAFQKVLPWLFKKYTGTPTTPDLDSSSGPGNQEPGKNSTENT